MSNIENPEQAFQRIKAAAKARIEIPKFTFSVLGGMLAFALFILREYDKSWPVIDYLSSLAVLSLLVAAVAVFVRIGAIRQIETLDDGEIFEGRPPDVNSDGFLRKLAQWGRASRVAARIALPSAALGLLFLAASLLTVVLYHLVT